jgi:hypothetical protein
VSTALIISLSDLGRDPRVDRQIRALVPHYRVIAAGLGAPAITEVAYVDLSPPRQARAAVALQRAHALGRLMAGRPERAFWCNGATRHAARVLADVARCADVVIANDIATLPLALALPGRPPVVYDAHEYAPREQEDKLWFRLIMRPYLDRLGKACIPRAASMMTVSDGIAEQYARDAGVHPVVVTNAAAHADLTPTPVHSPIRVLHHGLAQPSRRIEEMIRAVQLAGPGFALDLVLAPHAPGYLERLRRLAQRTANVRVLPERPMHELVAAANDYDVGLYLLPPSSFNQRCALPNKFFEFIQARLALAIGPSPEMERYVRAWQCGVVSSDFTAQSLACALQSLTERRIARFKAAAHAAAAELCAERNAQLVVDVVAQALAAGHR